MTSSGQSTSYAKRTSYPTLPSRAMPMPMPMPVPYARSARLVLLGPWRV